MLLKLMQWYVPDWIKKQKLKELYRLTIQAFPAVRDQRGLLPRGLGMKDPSFRFSSYETALNQYAAATGQLAAKYLQSSLPTAAVQRRLFRNAYRWGTKLRRLLGIHTWEQSITALEFLYCLIGIELRCTESLMPNRCGCTCPNFVQPDNKARPSNQRKQKISFTVSRCYFSNYYTPEICRLMQALDSGLAAGLIAGGTLRFRKRITEGYTCCLGTIQKTDAIKQ